MGLTLRQSNFVKKYIEFANATEAAAQVYNVKNRNVAGVIGWENLRKHKVVEAINASFMAGQVSPVSIAQTIKQVMINGTPRQQLRAIEIYLKAIGDY